MSSFEAHAIPPDDLAAAAPASSISTGPPRLTPGRELELVDAHRQGDPQALSELLRAYQRRVYAICYRMVRDVDLASDLTQDVLVKLIESLDKYDGRARLSTWVYRVAANCCLSHLRKAKLRRHASLDGAARGAGDDSGDSRRGLSDPSRGMNDPVSREPSAAHRVEQDEQRAILQAALMSLDPEVRVMLVLRDMQDLDYEQISEVLGIPVGTVKSRLFRARSALRTEAERRAGEGDDER